jgi:hypothetical protein
MLDLPTVVKSVLFVFGREIGLFLVRLIVVENEGMHQNYRFMMD